MTESRMLEQLTNKKNWNPADLHVERLYRTMMFDNEIDQAAAELTQLCKDLNDAIKALDNVWEWAGEDNYARRTLTDICFECREYFDTHPEVKR